MEKYNLRYLKPSAFIFICVVLGISLITANNYINSHWGISVSVFAVIGALFGIINSYLWNKKPFCWMHNVLTFQDDMKVHCIMNSEMKNAKLFRGCSNI